MQPPLGVDDVQEDFADGPFGGPEAFVEAIVGTGIEQRSQFFEVLGERSLDVDGDVYRISDDVYLNLYPTRGASRTVSMNGGGGTTH